MANIKITVEGPLMDGHKITFKAPCNCDVVEKLDVRYIENNTQKSILFTMKDSHGNDLTGLGNLFFKDAYVDVVLDPNSGSAYLQNAGTNAYLEEKFKTAVSVTPVDNLESDRADLPLSARQGKILNDSLEWKQLPESALPITIPMGAKEFYAYVKNESSGGYKTTPILPIVHNITWFIGDIFYTEIDGNNTLKNLTEFNQYTNKMYTATSVRIFWR